MAQNADGRVNGHRSINLVERSVPGNVPDETLNIGHISFDVEERLRSVVAIESEIDPSAHTAPYLGTHRQGNGIIIDHQGLILTIGYLILEIGNVWVQGANGENVPADFVGYDFENGFGLVRARQPLNLPPLPFGSSADLVTGQEIIVAAAGGVDHSMSAVVSAIRPFAGYWEYFVDRAIYTLPAHPNWSGAGLLTNNGRLAGLGSLMVETSKSDDGSDSEHGNMFVPIDLLTNNLNSLVTNGRIASTPRPWLGVFASENDGHLSVMQVTQGGPADQAGLAAADVIVKINGEVVSDLPEFYLKLWDSGPAGIPIALTILRESHAFDITIKSVDRYTFFQTPFE